MAPQPPTADTSPKQEYPGSEWSVRVYASHVMLKQPLTGSQGDCGGCRTNVTLVLLLIIFVSSTTLYSHLSWGGSSFVLSARSEMGKYVNAPSDITSKVLPCSHVTFSIPFNRAAISAIVAFLST